MWRSIPIAILQGYVHRLHLPPYPQLKNMPTMTKDVIIDLTFDGGQTSTNLNNVYSYLKDFQLLGAYVFFFPFLFG